MKKVYVFILIMELIASCFYAQVQKLGIPEIEYFNRRMYNGATQNWSVTQSRVGFIYFANNDGVLEFDGVNWRVHKDLGNYIVRSVKGIGDKIYAGAYNEFGYFDYDSLNILKYTSLIKDPKLKELEDIWNIHEWNERIVFQSKKGLSIYMHDELQKIIPAPSRFVSSFVVNELLIIQDEKKGLMEVRGEQAFPVSGGQLLAGKEVTSIMALSNSKIIIGTMNNGLYLWDMQKVVPWNVSANPLLKEVNIFCGCKYSDDLFVFGTIQGGLIVIDKSGNVFMKIDKDKGLKNNTVLGVFVDVEGHIWCGLDNGIAKVSFNSSISFLQGYFNIGKGYVMSHHKNNYYFGTNQALYKIDVKGFNDPLKDRNNFERISNTEGQVWSLYSDDEVLLCGHNLGAYEVKGSKASVITPPGVNGVWNFIKIPKKPDLLISGTYGGLIAFQKKGKRWFFRNIIKGFSVSSRYMEWDEMGNLWVSHGYKGVFKLKLNDDLTEVLSYQNYKITDFPGNSKPIVLKKIEGKCTYSSNDGVFEINNSGKVTRHAKIEELFKNKDFPEIISQDKFGNIWSFAKGKVTVHRLMEDGSYKEIFYPFLILERKLVNGFEYLYVDDKNNVFFGIEDGFAHYSASDYRNYKIPFNTHIRSFVGAGDSLEYQVNSSKYKQIYIPEYVFRKNSFQINYSASYYGDKDLLYTTILEGSDNYSTDWNKSNTISFSNLIEGEYIFKVKAKNRFGVEASPVKFKFIILPPWYRSNPAKIGFAVLFIVIVVLIYYVFSRRLELSREKEKRKQQEEFRIKEEQLKNTALTSEKEMIRLRNEKLRNEMVYKEKELANSTVNLIQKNDLLSDIKFQLKTILKISEKNELERKVRSLIKKIDKDIDNENNWEVFEMHFGQVHEAFFQKLRERHANLTSREQKLCAYIKMGMASKDIASLMNITTRAVENNRYKLRQKLELHQGDNLLEYIESI